MGILLIHHSCMRPQNKHILDYSALSCDFDQRDMTYVAIRNNNNSGIVLIAQLRPIDQSNLMITSIPTCSVCECINPVYVSRDDTYTVPPYFCCENCARIIHRAKDYLASADKFSPRMDKMDYIDDVKYFARMHEVKEKIIHLCLLAANITLKDIASVISAHISGLIFAENKLTSEDFLCNYAIV